MRRISLPKQFPVTCHTDHVGPGSTFVAIQGYSRKGTQFITESLLRGAKRIIIDRNEQLDSDIEQAIVDAGAALERVENTRLALALESARAAGNPADKLRILAITGTKGKSTTSFLLFYMLKSAGKSVALLSTIKNKIGDQEFPAPLTTAQPDYLHQFLKTCVENGVTHVVMEVAAQALTLHRVAGIEWSGIIFTNFSREHLEFYATIEEYFAAKCSIFSQRKQWAAAWINGDDARLSPLTQKYDDVFTFAIDNSQADVQGTYQEECGALKATIRGLSAGCCARDGVCTVTCPSLFGRYNLYNILAASVLAKECGVSEKEIVVSLATFPCVPGRMERYQTPKGVTCIIDYAHNPDSYEQLLPVLRAQTHQLIVIFGAGGDRDAGKRPLMGAAAAEYADHIFLTTDNPRSEDAGTIAAQIKSGIEESKQGRVTIELDREKAIRIAYDRANPGAIIVLLGKGPDEYQQFGTTKIPFSEKEIISRLGR